MNFLNCVIQKNLNEINLGKAKSNNQPTASATLGSAVKLNTSLSFFFCYLRPNDSALAFGYKVQIQE